MLSITRADFANATIFQDRVMMILFKYCHDILDTAHEPSLITHVALDVLHHPEDYKKRIPGHVAAILPDIIIFHNNIEDKDIEYTMPEIFGVLAREF